MHRFTSLYLTTVKAARYGSLLATWRREISGLISSHDCCCAPLFASLNTENGFVRAYSTRSRLYTHQSTTSTSTPTSSYYSLSGWLETLSAPLRAAITHLLSMLGGMMRVSGLVEPSPVHLGRMKVYAILSMLVRCGKPLKAKAQPHLTCPPRPRTNHR